METALVLSRYAGWCGGTAAKAASYPISNMIPETAPKPGTGFVINGLILSMSPILDSSTHTELLKIIPNPFYYNS